MAEALAPCEDHDFYDMMMRRRYGRMDMGIDPMMMDQMMLMDPMGLHERMLMDPMNFHARMMMGLMGDSECGMMSRMERRMMMQQARMMRRRVEPEEEMPQLTVPDSQDDIDIIEAEVYDATEVTKTEDKIIQPEVITVEEETVPVSKKHKDLENPEWNDNIDLETRKRLQYKEGKRFERKIHKPQLEDEDGVPYEVLTFIVKKKVPELVVLNDEPASPIQVKENRPKKSDQSDKVMDVDEDTTVNFYWNFVDLKLDDVALDVRSSYLRLNRILRIFSTGAKEFIVRMGRLNGAVGRGYLLEESWNLRFVWLNLRPLLMCRPYNAEVKDHVDLIRNCILDVIGRNLDGMIKKWSEYLRAVEALVELFEDPSLMKELGRALDEDSGSLSPDSRKRCIWPEDDYYCTHFEMSRIKKSKNHV